MAGASGPFGLSRIKERLLNYPGRNAFNDAVKQMRGQIIRSLPATASTVSEFAAETPWNRWADLDPAAYPTLLKGAAADRATRTGRMRRFDGDLSIDPYALTLFDNRRRVSDSFDGIGREREPVATSYLFRASERYDELVNLRGAYENNYFHFLYDFVPKWLMTDACVDTSVPAVIGEVLARQPFFKGALDLGLFANRKLIVMGKSRSIGASRIWVPSPREPNRDDLLAIARLFGADTLPDEGLRLYVARGAQALNKRRLTNEAEMFAHLEKRGFLFFDPQEHGLHEQIRMFAAARIVVSPHGAGLTNTIWRAGRPTDVVELVNTSMTNMDLAYISFRMGYPHARLENIGDIGQPLRASAAADIPAVLGAVDTAITLI